MYKEVYRCKISYKEEIAPGIIDMKVVSSDMVKQAKPGQFLNVKCSDGLTAILRRPISICDVDLENEEVRFVFQIKGTGTRLLYEKNVGDTLDILGPLGTSFQQNTEKFSRPLLIGGGIGIFPLLMLAKSISSGNAAAFLGFRNQELVVLEDDFKKSCAQVKIATDDGSYGFKGYVTQLMEEALKAGQHDIVYACGPQPMLKLIKNICDTYRVPCQLSMEQRMGCGIGACLVCACKAKSGEDEWEYKHVCKDGPVFWGDEVMFDE